MWRLEGEEESVWRKICHPSLLHMASSEGEGLRVIQMFRGENFHQWKVRMELALAALDLWDIVQVREVGPSSSADAREHKEFQRCEKKAFGILANNLDDANFAHIISCKGVVQAWRTLCNIYESRNLSNIIFTRRKFLTCKMEEGEDLMAHVNKLKALASQLAVVATR